MSLLRLDFILTVVVFLCLIVSKPMKSRFFITYSIASVLTVAAILTGCNQQKPSVDKSETTAVSENKLPAKIVVGLDDNFPPMGFRDENQKLIGFDIDMAREAATRLGTEVEFKPIDWSAKEAELNGKRIDMIWNGMTITEERKKQLAFTKPYLQNHQIIIVSSKSPIQKKADLAGKTIGIQDGSSAVDAVNKDAISKKFKELNKFGDNVAALMDLSTGRLDAVVVDEVVGRYYTSKKPGQYRVLEENFGSEDYGVGLRKEDTALLAKLDEVLDAMRADGSAKAIYAKWFEEAKK